MSKSLILFGSQTGNAEAISELLSKKINIEFQPLSFIGKNIEMLEKYEYIYLIISTTGDGEPPNNALTFFRYLKKKKRNNYKLPNLKYSILALGSTDYSNFCKPGKDIYKLLKTMSATPLLNLYIADDATNANETIDDWIQKVQSFKIKKKQNKIVRDKINCLNYFETKLIKKQIKNGYGIITLQFLKPVVWHPGQTIALYMPSSNKPRYYSIASSPMQKSKYNEITLIFSIIGEYTKWLSSLNLESLVHISITEPNPFIYIERKTAIHMICMGSGISVIIGLLSQYFYIIKELHDGNIKYVPPINLYFGCKSPEKIIGKELLDKYISVINKVHYSFSKNGDPYIQKYITLNQIKKSDTIYCCGNTKMVKEIIERFPNNKIIYESWN